MAYQPISGIVPQLTKNAGGASASGHYLKGYAAGTTTPLSMGTDSTPTATLAKCKLNTRGEPISNDADETTVFIPYFNASYKLVLYVNSTDADANTTANAVWVVDNITGLFDASDISYNANATVVQKLNNLDVDDYTALRAITVAQLADNDSVNVAYRTTEGDGGGGRFVWSTTDYSTEVTADTQSGIYVAPNSDATGASGCFVRADVLGQVFSEWFGAIPDASTICDVPLQAAIDFTNTLTDGVEVKLQAGTYKITSQIVLDARASLIGSGMNTTRINSATGLSPFKIVNAASSGVVEGAGISYMSISLDNAAIGIEIVDVWWTTIEYVRFRDGGTTTGTLVKGSGQSFHIRVSNCRLVGAQNYGVDFIDDVNSSAINDNDFGMPDGATAIRVQDASHIAIFNNRYEQGGSDAGTKIELENADNCPIYGNTMGNSNASIGINIIGDSQDNEIFGNRIATDGALARGVVIAGTSKQNAITGNTFLIQGVSTAGVQVDARNYNTIVGNTFDCTGVATEAAVSLKNSASNILINSNSFRDSSGATSATGILIEAGCQFITAVGNNFSLFNIGVSTLANTGGETILITNNTFNSNTTDVNVGTASANRIKSNIGYLTEGVGTGSITSGGTTDVITHGLDVTPDMGSISIVLTENPTNTPGAIYLSSVGATTFTVNCENDPGASNLDFSWSVSG